MLVPASVGQELVKPQVPRAVFVVWAQQSVAWVGLVMEFVVSTSQHVLSGVLEPVVSMVSKLAAWLALGLQTVALELQTVPLVAPELQTVPLQTVPSVPSVAPETELR